ncbi:MAG: M20 family metallopeptidase [Acidobacteria bacterium]|nr:M20 family metallopeptidase [Acidobacteriota bacterium]
MDVDALKAALCAHIDTHAEDLVAVSHAIHAAPEEKFAEHRAHDLLCGRIEAAGLGVERHAFELATAFRSSAGTSGPDIAVMLEYDALPGLGHACGHNIIAAAGLGAGLAAAALAPDVGGRVTILGCPAEEGGGGKVLMIDRGALEGIDAAMMVHPADADLLTMNAIAFHGLDAVYTGRAAHAAAHPWQGRNALDAAVLGYMNVAALRQHIAPDQRIHGVFTDGGDKPNIVPSRAAMNWYVRAGDLEALEDLKLRVVAALEAGALAAGCEVEITWRDPAYADLVDNASLAGLYRDNAARLGRTVLEPDAHRAVVGSTDMGNVSHVVPSIHPMIAVAPAGVGIHTAEFAVHAAAADGDRAVIDGAKAMAMTIADLWADPIALERVRDSFTTARAGRGG